MSAGFVPDVNAPKPVERKIGLKELFQFCSPADRWRYYIGCFFASVNGMCWPGSGYLFGEMLEQGMGNPDTVFDEMIKLVWLFVYLGLISFLCTWIFSACIDTAAENQAMRIRKIYFGTVLRQDQAWYDHKDPLILPSRMIGDVSKIKEALGKQLGLAWMNLSQFFAGYGFAFYVSWRISLVASSVLPFMAYATFVFITILATLSSASQQFYTHAGGVADEVLTSTKTVVAYNRQDFEVSRYAKHLEKTRALQIRFGLRTGFMIGSVDFCILMVYAIAFYYGAILIRDGATTIDGDSFNGGHVLKCFLGLLFGMFGLGQVGPWVTAFAEAKPALRNILNMLDVEKPSIEKREKEVYEGRVSTNLSNSWLEGNSSSEGGTWPNNVRTQGGSSSGGGGHDLAFRSGELKQIVFIEANNIEFCYPTRPDLMVLKQVNFRINRGEKVSFVGESGSGKSTIIQLLERFYEAKSGTLTFDGKDIKSIPVNELRSQCGYVSQEPVLFQGTIRDNILSGLNRKVSDEEIMQVCRLAQIDKMIDSLPEKLNTLPGAGGSQLSGGQKQRIAITRALIRKPKLLLLDEATSALDYESERLVQETIDNLGSANNTASQGLGFQDKLTVVIVAHRLSTVKTSDSIFFLKEGVIKEKGSFQELCALEGDFYKLVKTQEERDKKDDEGDHTPLGDRLPSRTKSESKDDSPKTRSVSISKGERGLSKGAVEIGKTGSMDDTTMDTLLMTEEQREAKRAEELAKTYQIPTKRLVMINTPQERFYYIPAFLAAGIYGAYQPVLGFVMTDVMESWFVTDKGRMMDETMVGCIWFAALAFIVMVCKITTGGCFGYIGANMTYRVRCMLLGTILRQDQSYLDKPENAPGILSTILATKGNDIGNCVGPSMGAKLEAMGALVLGIAFALYANWKLALIISAFLPVLVAAMIVMFVAIMGSGAGESPEVLAAGNVAAEAILNIKTVRGLQNEKEIEKNYEKKVEHVLVMETKKAFKGGFAFGFSQVLVFAIYAIGFGFGAHFIRYEGEKIGDVFKCVMCIMFGGMGAGQAAQFMPNMQKCKAAAHDIFGLVDRECLVDQTVAGNEMKKTLVGDTLQSIEYTEVLFSYPERPTLPILRGLTFTINAGESVAFVGPSGSGKSTIMALIQRYYDPIAPVEAEERNHKMILEISKKQYAGTVKINGVDIKEMNLLAWRSKIGYVGQEPVLFDAGARDNILYGLSEKEAKNIPQSKIDEIAELCCIDFIGKRPDQLQWSDPIGARGSKISGGQKQRIAIARALIRDPQLLLLDEATSALDAKSEKEVQAAIDNIAQSKTRNITSMTIAHRLSTIMNCDKIFVVADGKILEQGNHQSLMGSKGLYWKLQQSAK